MFSYIGKCQITLSYSAFTANTFSSADEWSVIGGNEGYDVQESMTIFGGNNYFGARVSIYRQILISSPHHTIRLKMRKLIHGIMNLLQQKQMVKQLIIRQLVQIKEINLDNSYIKKQCFFFFCIFENHQYQKQHLHYKNQQQKNLGESEIFTYIHTIVQQDVISVIIQIKILINVNLIYLKQIILKDLIFIQMKTGTTLTKQYFFEPHFELKITFQFWKFEAIATSQYSLKVDELVVWSDHKTKSQKIEICGRNSYAEQYYNVDIRINHIYQYPTFKFVSDSIIPTDYFGIREFSVYMLACDSSCELCEINADSCIQGTKLTQIQMESDLTQNSFITQQEWGSYTPSDASGQISMSTIADTYFSNINYLSLYNLLYKDFELEDHDKIKIQFQAYSYSVKLNLNMKIDEDYDEIVSIGENVQTTACSLSLTHDIENYSFLEYIFDHTANFIRIQFESQPYIFGDYKYGFNQRRLHQQSL
ncbi:unnamed protein product [Paramecium sonneborni]|uniref:Uncharacterized protein n=1 Tax=Paramecium sonneborni TaxID=65129 RepID=A0A8S1RBS2_9CILI|nr:unnamed protein product [Paramecium sonneborni]